MDFESQYLNHKIPSWTQYYFEYQELDYILNKYFNRKQINNSCKKREKEMTITIRKEKEENKNSKNKKDSLNRNYSEHIEDHELNLENFKIEFKKKIGEVDKFFISTFKDLDADYKILKQFISSHQTGEHNITTSNEVKFFNNYLKHDGNNFFDSLKSFHSFKSYPNSKTYYITCRTALFHLY